MNWKKKEKVLKLNEFIGYFRVFIKQCYRTAWSVEKIQKVIIQEL